MCISETFLNYTKKNKYLPLNGNSLLRAIIQTMQRDEKFLFITKKLSPLKCYHLLCKVTIRSKKCFMETIHRSPSQNPDEFESFLPNFEFLLGDISNLTLYLTLLLGDYNTRNMQ